MERLAFDPGRPVTHDDAPGAGQERAAPPRMLLRPPDQTPPLANVAESEAVRTFRLEFATQRQVQRVARARFPANLRSGVGGKGLRACRPPAPLCGCNCNRPRSPNAAMHSRIA